MSFSRFLKKATRDVRGFFATDHVVLFPFTRDLRGYDRATLRQDARAAVSVAMLSVAQAIAFASIAGLPVVYGMMCAAVSAIVAPLFTGSRHNILGPTNSTAFMLFSFFAVNPALAWRWAELMPLLVLMVGLISVAGALCRVADLLQYISRSVLVGYITGAAILIITNQLVPLLGVGKYLDHRASLTFFGMIFNLGAVIHRTDWVPVVVGAASVAIYFAMKRWKPAWPAFAFALLLSSAIFGSLSHFKIGPFEGLATFTTFNFEDLMPELPDLIGPDIFTDVSDLLGVSLALAFLCSLENTLMAKTLASTTGDVPDVNQDMLGVGMTNLASAIAGGMPASGSMTRSTLNLEAGAKTRFASFFCGIYTLGAAILIAASVNWRIPLMDFVPKPALAALVIALSLGLFNFRNIRICLRSTADDGAVLILTFVATLLAPLHVAIFVGVAISIMLFLRKASRPFLVEYEFSEAGELREVGQKNRRPIPAISIVHVEGDLFFGAADLFRTQIQKTVADPSVRVIILRLKNARHLDATSVMALEDLIHFLRARGLHLLISGATREVYQILKKSGILATLQEGARREEGETNLFLNWPSNPNLSTRDALKRAQQLLGTDEAEIRIFYDPQKDAKSPKSTP